MRKLAIGVALTVLVTGVGVVCFGAHARGEGRDRLAGVLAAQEQAGYGSDLTDLTADLPALDPDRQARLMALMETREEDPSSYARPLDTQWYLAGKDTPPEEDRTWAESQRPFMTALQEILREGPVSFTSLAWIQAKAAEIESLPVGKRAPRLPHLLRLREAHRFFGYEAMTADDPAQALDTLDALEASLRPVGGLIDAMIAGACSAMRDHAYLRLAVRGALPADRMAAWVDESPQFTQLVANAWRGERLLYWAPLGRRMLEGARLADEFPGHDWNVHDAFYAEQDCAAYIDFLGASEGLYRGDASLESFREKSAAVEDWGLVYKTSAAMHQSMAVFVVGSNTSHRMRRLSARLAARAHREERAPRNAEEAMSWLHPHTLDNEDETWISNLALEMSGPTRVRITIDPNTPVPAIVSDGAQAAFLRRSRFGKEPRSTHLAVDPQGVAFDFMLPRR